MQLPPILLDIMLVLVAFAAGAQNAVAGGGSFLTFPALLLAGLDPRAANITSTIALFPGQITTGLAGRKMVEGAAGLSFRTLFAISLIGGTFGAFLLLATPSSIFAKLVPYLVLFATAVFAWGSFFRRSSAARARSISPRVAIFLQFLIAIYGGYFGGGIGILMIAALTAAGLAVRGAGATKNVLAGVMNTSAVLVFLAETSIHWKLVSLAAVGAIAGGQLGVVLLRRINEKILRIAVITIGILLTIGLFIQS
ncbi:MAG TPA: sulfite exporter TauE/SafE family protein [Acetobacteraceae bacterium]|nr:sulfite exporter TauE/SafE family protein [Acetobacteraceae bacterium]